MYGNARKIGLQDGIVYYMWVGSLREQTHGLHGPGKLLEFLGAVLEFYEVLEYLKLQQNKFILASKG